MWCNKERPTAPYPNSVLSQFVIMTPTTTRVTPRKSHTAGFCEPGNVRSAPDTVSRQALVCQTLGQDVAQPLERRERDDGEQRSIPHPQGIAAEQTSYQAVVPETFITDDTSTEEVIILKSKLRRGKISYEPGDLEILTDGFQVPDVVAKNLLKRK